MEHTMLKEMANQDKLTFTVESNRNS